MKSGNGFKAFPTLFFSVVPQVQVKEMSSIRFLSFLGLFIILTFNLATAYVSPVLDPKTPAPFYRSTPQWWKTRPYHSITTHQKLPKYGDLRRNMGRRIEKQEILGAEWDVDSKEATELAALMCPPESAICPVLDDCHSPRVLHASEWPSKLECVDLQEDVTSCGGCSSLDSK